MMQFQIFFDYWMMPFGGLLPFAVGGFLFTLLIIWSLAWKGMALWKSAREGA